MFTDSDDDVNHGDYNDYIVTPPPKKKMKALSSQQKLRQPKPHQDMSPREQQRHVSSYEHPIFCCRRKECHRYISEPTVRLIRDRVWSECGNDSRRAKIEIAKVWSETFLVDGEKCCIKFLINAFGVSRMFIYPDRRNSASKVKSADTREAIINFFEELKMECDRMPDCDEYHIYAPKKANVYEWYMAWVGMLPCSREYFLKTWRQVAKDVKLRKYLRFTKCKTCAELREVLCNLFTF